MDSIMDTFEYFLKNLSHIPSVSFKNNNEFSYIVNKLHQKFITQLQDDGELNKISSIDVDKFIEVFRKITNNDAENDGILVKLDNLSNAMASKLANIQNEFKTNISSMVEDLSTKIFDKRNKMLQTSGKADIINKAQLEPKYLKFDWNINCLGTDSLIVNVLHNQAKLSQNADAKTTYIPYILNHLNTTIEHIDIPDELEDRLQRAVLLHNPELDTENVTLLVRFLTNYKKPNKLHNNFNTSFYNIISDNMLLRIKNNINTYYPILNDIKQAVSDFELSSLRQDALLKNINTLENIFKIQGYYLIACRSNQFKNTIYFPNIQMINSDNAEEFYQNNTNQTIANYLQAFYDVDEPKYPSIGLTLKLLETTKPTVQKNISLKKNKTKKEATTILKQTTYVAYDSIIKDYIKDVATKKSFINEQSKQLYLQNAASNLIATSNRILGKNDNIEDALYTFLLNTHADNKMFSTIYNNLKEETIKFVDISSDITNDNKAQILAKVFTNIISDFISNYYE